LISQKSIKSVLETFRIEWYSNNSKYEESIDALNEKISKFEDLRLKVQVLTQKNREMVSNHIETIKQKDIMIKLSKQDFKQQLDAAKIYQQNIESDYKAKIERLNTTLSYQNDEIDKLITHKSMIESNLDETSKSLNDTINLKTRENQALSRSLEVAKIETARLNSELDKISTSLSHQEQIISNNLDEMKSYASKIQDLNSIIDKLKQDIVQRDESYAHDLKLAKRDISELVSATNTKLSDQISVYTQHIQALQTKLSAVESVKKLIKKANNSRSQTISNLHRILDKTQTQLRNSEQSLKQSISDSASLQKKVEIDFQAESSRLNQIISHKDEEIKRLLSDKSMMANNLDSTCRVLNDSLQLQIQQNKTLDSKLDEASREISRLNQEVTSKSKDLEIKSRELDKCVENLLQANEKGKELSMLCSNLENNLKLNRQFYTSAIKFSKDTIFNISGNINKNMQELIKNMSDKIEILQAKVIHLEKVKPLLIRKISSMNISIQDKSKNITTLELDLKNTEDNYKRLLENADKLQKKSEQEYSQKLNLLNLATKQKDEESQKLTLDKYSLENTVKSLTDAVQTKTSENQALSASLSEAESEISNLKSEIADYKSASNKSSISLSQLEKELSTLREDLKSKNQRIIDLNSFNTSLQTDIKSKEKAFIDSLRQAKRNITQLCEVAAKNMQLEMKRLSNSIQILEIKQQKLQAAKDDIQKNNLKKSLAISKLASALKDKENQLLNLLSKDKSNYQVIESLRKDQEEILSAKDDEIQNLKEQIVGYLNKIKLLEINIQNKEQAIIEINTKLEEKEESMIRAMKDYKIENERKLEEANSRIESLTSQLSLRDKESGSEISSLNKLYQDTIDNHQQVLDSVTEKAKKREDELLYEIDKLSKQLKNKEADYLRLEKKSASFKSMYDSLKSLVNTLHENLPKIRCKSSSAQSWLLKYINIKLPSDSSSYNLLTSVLGVYNSISQNKASLTPQILAQISDMYTYKQTENSSIESTQDSMPIFREYSEEIYGVVNDMINLLEAQDMMLQEQTHKTSCKHPAHSRPVIFTGNITDKSKLGIISNLDRLKVPLNKFITRLIHKPEENIDIMPDSKPLAQDAIISLFDSPANTDSMKALHEIGETVDNMKQLLLNLGNFISLLGAYCSTVLNTNLSLEKSLKNSQNLLSSLFSLSNYQSIKLHNKRLSHQNTKFRLNFLSQEYTNFKKNLEEETSTTFLKDKSARSIQRFWRHKLKQRNIRIALKVRYI
jgi:chromosome segregation ATPase